MNNIGPIINIIFLFLEINLTLIDFYLKRAKIKKNFFEIIKIIEKTLKLIISIYYLINSIVF